MCIRDSLSTISQLQLHFSSQRGRVTGKVIPPIRRMLCSLIALQRLYMSVDISRTAGNGPCSDYLGTWSEGGPSMFPLLWEACPCCFRSFGSDFGRLHDDVDSCKWINTSGKKPEEVLGAMIPFLANLENVEETMATN
eukprot:TRINITY_DN9120_c0_g1_i3.p1 TRINITY_DN9120_c0_g1~~TRINITY_DN9120_c0_g1_i3.p1  ORF type:complete len:157 (-),score=16.13 TRINITY_DN9120_c0_g1_i3:26-439(-)